MFQRTVLDNQLRVLTTTMPHTASVSMTISVGAGSRYESEEQAGLSHFIEHLPFKGSKNWPTARQISEAIEGVGGVMNASTLDRRAIVLDGHHTRILQRMGLVPPRASTDRAFAAIMPAMPEEWSAADFDEHHLLMKKLGQSWCRPSSPDCATCPAQALCATGRGQRKV